MGRTNIMHTWHGNLIVRPSRLAVSGEIGRAVGSRVSAMHAEAIEGVRRYLANSAAMAYTREVRLAPDRCEIIVAVERVSDDHDADCKRMEGIVNAAFYGDAYAISEDGSQATDAAPSATTEREAAALAS